MWKSNLSSCVHILGCEYVEITSNGKVVSKQYDRFGVYKRENYLEEGKFVFKQLGKDQFLYSLSNGDWLVILILHGLQSKIIC